MQLGYFPFYAVCSLVEMWFENASYIGAVEAVDWFVLAIPAWSFF